MNRNTLAWTTLIAMLAVLAIVGIGSAEETFTEHRIETTATNTIDIAVINETSWVAAWEDGDLRFAKTDDSGQTWTTPLTIEGMPDCEDPCIDIEVQNETIYGIAFHDGNTVQRIDLQFTTDGGQTWTKENVVDTGSGTNESFFPSLAISPDGDTWAVSWQAEDNRRPWVATSSDRFNTTDTNQQINNINDYFGPLDLEFPENDILHLSITAQNFLSGCKCIEFWESVNNGVSWAKKGETQKMGRSLGVAELTSLSSSVTAIANTASDSSGNDYMNFSISFDGGNSWTTEDLGIDLNRTQDAPALIGFNSGTWVIAWSEHPGGSVTNPPTFVAKTIDGGSSWDINFTVTNGVQHADNPQPITGETKNDTAYVIAVAGTKILESDPTEIGDPIIVLSPTDTLNGFNDLRDVRTDWTTTGGESIILRDTGDDELIALDPNLAEINRVSVCRVGQGLGNLDSRYGLYVTVDAFVIEACTLTGASGAGFGVWTLSLGRTDRAFTLAAADPATELEAFTMNEVAYLENDNTHIRVIDAVNLEQDWAKQINALSVDINKGNTTQRNVATTGTFGTRLYDPSGVLMAADASRSGNAVAVDNTTVYVARETSNTVEKLDRSGSSFSVNATGTEFVDVGGLRLSKDGRLLMAWGSDDLTIFNTTDMSVVTTISGDLTDVEAADIPFQNDALYMINSTQINRYDLTGFSIPVDATVPSDESTAEGDAPDDPFTADDSGLFGSDTLTPVGNALGTGKLGAQLLLAFFFTIGGAIAIYAETESMGGATMGAIMGFALAFGVGVLPVWAVVLAVIVGAAVIVLRADGG